MYWKNNGSFFRFLVATSIKSTISMRGAFLIESLLMLANNLIFFYVWWIFFEQYDNVGGWQIKDMTALMAVGLGAYGSKQVLFGGLRNLSRMIINGGLDPYMTQPKNLLLHIASSRSLAKGWGHLMSALIMIVLGGLNTFPEFPLILLSIVCGTLIFAAMEVVAHSITFWLGTMESFAHRYTDSLFLFTLYPTNIYSGTLQVILFTVLPAGIIGNIPVELVRSFVWTKLFIMLASTAFFVGLAFCVFYSGLKRYESGNQFTT